VGDGNFHIAYLIDPDGDAKEQETAERLNSRWSSARSRWGHLHRRARHRAAQAGLPGRRGRRRRGRDDAHLKRALDPKNILNPGRSFALSSR
jgi:D-lactate dehydrogenase (cytochrome)